MVKATGDIITVAGNGTAGYSGDNGPATAAELDRPPRRRRRLRGRPVHRRQYNNMVREVVKATGDIITVAGDGTAGYSGDNGPATAAELDNPVRVAVDSAGDLFISDSYNNVVREVTPAVTVTIGPSSALPTLTALVASTASAAARAVGHVHRDRQRPVRGRGHSERGDGHLQRPERSDRQRDAGRRRGGVHDLEPGGGHDTPSRPPTAAPRTSPRAPRARS